MAARSSSSPPPERTQHVFEYQLSRTDASSGRETHATVTAIGASIRTLTVDGIDLVQPYPPGPPPLGAGLTLFPWPNRVEDGRWWWRGREQQLQITDPISNCAIHGFLATTGLEVFRHDETSLELRTEIEQPPGYPFTVQLTVGYELSAAGIRVRHTIVNRGSTPAPVALGAHPYLVLGNEPLDELRLTVPASERLPLDGRNLPGPPLPVAGTAFDLQSGVRVSAVPDHVAYANLTPTDGLVRMSLTGHEHAVELWAVPEFAWAQIYRTDDFPASHGPTPAIAVEPMTAPPNALRSGHGLRWLPPGGGWSPEWGIALRPRNSHQ